MTKSASSTGGASDLEDVESLRSWVERFSECVATVDFESAATMLAPEVTSFSTWHDIVRGIDHFVNAQWRKVWPMIDQFRIESEKMITILSPDRLMASVAFTWASVGFDEEHAPFDRPGRGTFVLVRDARGEPWRAMHAHFSLDRGVPSQSYGMRAPAT